LQHCSCRATAHREKIAEVFRIAGIDYRRIDHGVKDGRIQVWEINTNPMVMPRREKIHSLPAARPGLQSALM
jgi:hypothetical protein